MGLVLGGHLGCGVQASRERNRLDSGCGNDSHFIGGLLLALHILCILRKRDERVLVSCLKKSFRSIAVLFKGKDNG